MIDQHGMTGRFRALREGAKSLIFANARERGFARLLLRFGRRAVTTSNAALAAALGRRDDGLTRGAELAPRLRAPRENDA